MVLPDNGAACRRRLLEIRSGRPRKPIQNSRCRRAFTLPRLSGDRYAIFTSLTHRFTGRQQTDLLFEPMILQSPQNVNTVCVFAFSMGVALQYILDKRIKRYEE